jgi:hypothetical protein
VFVVEAVLSSELFTASVGVIGAFYALASAQLALLVDPPASVQPGDSPAIAELHADLPESGAGWSRSVRDPSTPAP